MKHVIKFRKQLLSAFVSLALAGSASTGLAQDLVISTFDDDSWISGMWPWWGGATYSYSWDSSQDASNNPSSGSLKITATFTGEPGQQYAIGASLAGGWAYNSSLTVTCAFFTNLVMDVLWDTNSTIATSTFFGSGDPQGLGLGLATPTWGQTWIPNANQPVLAATGTWERVVIPLNPTWPNVPALIFKKWFGGALNGTITFWVDNIRFVPVAGPPPPPPTLTLTRVGNNKGLQLFTSAPGNLWQRQSIRTLGGEYSWYNAGDTMTYSFTLTNFPTAPDVQDFQAHIFLVPGEAGFNMPWGPGDSFIDWNATNAIFLRLQYESGAGNYVCRFMYKTNQGSGNSMFFGAGMAAAVTNPVVLGTWSVTFANNTDFTLTGPGGASASGSLPEDVAALFENPLYAYFGVQPNSEANIGRSATFSRIQILRGTQALIDDSFTTAPLDTVNTWAIVAVVPAGVVVVPQDAAYWLTWTLPDVGFGLQVSTNVVNPDSWVDADPELFTPRSIGGMRRVLVPFSVPGENAGYFRLLKPGN